ncbi:TonB-dependent receptor [Novosphingobium sp. ZN18A2]|uniref:TonB-dependent receptor plug domain-containing protein n=1 Tax=Novosphingobium sp. ZN18A2 TaxID=3079861 RepID=UPI0030D3083D
MKITQTSSFLAMAVALSMTAPVAAHAAEADAGPATTTAADAAAAASIADPGEAIVVTGVRGEPRSAIDSPVPVDVFSAKDLEQVSYTDTNDVLATISPSYTVSRQPISDGATFIRPASLRGLPTDKTLVLVNGKRRHRAALVQIGGSGTQGPDIATIPSIALKNVQVLRDGAAAQYGSDAIAGVINFILKDDTRGLEINAQTGQYYAGDGFNYNVSANWGIGIGDRGFIDISAEYEHADRTSRATQYCESYFCVDTYAATHPDYAAGVKAEYGDGVVQRWGRPKSEAVRGFVNAGYDFSDQAQFYAFGNYSRSKAVSDFFYRYPHNGTIEYVRKPDGSLWWPLDIFPGGFTPQFRGKVIDYSGVAGLKGELGDDFTYDVSARYGRDEIDYTIDHTINPSMGPDTPTSFAPGNLINTEKQFQIDLTKGFDLGLESPLLFAWGGSYLEESYNIEQGGADSYFAGPYSQPDPWGFCASGAPTAAGAAVIANGSTLNCADSSDPVYQVMGVGSNGFPGYSPTFSGIYKRHSYAVYGDLSTDITDRLFVEGALRWESYSDFPEQVIYKVAARYKLTDSLAFRASMGTGFRAPTPGQQGTTNVSTRISETGEPIASGLFPANSAVAAAIGASPLKPEKSVNYAAGLTANFGQFTLTLDGYWIKLKDRLNAVSPIAIVDDCDTSTPGIQTDCAGYRGNLVAAGVVGANSIGQVQYFANAFNTVTKGFDLVASYNKPWGGGMTTKATLALNYNETDFDGSVSSIFNAEDQFDFLNGVPKWKGILTLNHTMGALGLMARATYYGPYKNSDGGATITKTQNFGGSVYVDLEASYTFMQNYKLSVGARNVFDHYPDPGLFEAGQGRIYRSDSVVDWQGGYYYASVSLKF